MIEYIRYAPYQTLIVELKMQMLKYDFMIFIQKVVFFMTLVSMKTVRVYHRVGLYF